MQPQVRPVDRDNLLNDVKTKMERMIQKRVEAVRVRVRRGRCLLRLHSLRSLVRWQDKLSPRGGGGETTAVRLAADLRPSADGSAVRTWLSCRQPACKAAAGRGLGQTNGRIAVLLNAPPPTAGHKNNRSISGPLLLRPWYGSGVRRVMIKRLACVSKRGHISETTRTIFTKFSPHVTYGPVLLYSGGVAICYLLSVS